ncbi:hypothetical protein [Aquicoccus sp.]|uniref:hypothetical protein n=1 Tax=Aquicoccus sp. TaxID=2055851 RepID=UPI003569D6CA
MAFHRKIIFAALAITAFGAGAGIITAEESAPVLTDPGWWLAQGEALIGVDRNGWCRCI